MSTASPSQRKFVAGSDPPLPADLTGIRWRDGIVESHFRLAHPFGSLVADDGDVGVILTEPDAACTICSDTCAG